MSGLTISSFSQVRLFLFSMCSERSELFYCHETINRKGVIKLAVTSIWAVNNRIDKVIDYVNNPEKTVERPELSKEALAVRRALGDVIDYAENGDKTEKMMYVTGINCDKDHAVEIDKYCMPSIRTTVELKSASLGDDSNIYGSLAMIHDAEGTEPKTKKKKAAGKSKKE